MKQKKSLFVLAIATYISFAFIAQAQFNDKNIDKEDIVFDSETHVFHPTSTVPFLSQSLEQRFQTIKSINAIASRFEEDGSVALP